MKQTISFEYLNHRGEYALRTVDVDAIEYHQEPGYGYSPGWFISGFCHTKKARRSFSLTNITGNYEPGKNVFTLMRLG